MCGCAYPAQRATDKNEGKPSVSTDAFSDYGNWGSSAENIPAFVLFRMRDRFCR